MFDSTWIYCYSNSLPPSLPPSLSPYLPPFLPSSLPPSLPPSIPLSLPPSLPPSLSPSLPLSPQLRAEGCIVIIVGTYLDKVHDAEAQKLDKIVSEKFINPSRQGNSVYPKIVGCIFVSCVSKFKNNIDKLRQLIYEVSVHLQVSPKDGITRKSHLTKYL